MAVSEVTRILSQLADGDAHAAEKLLPLVYAELRKLAVARLAKERPGQTLQATALVHEAYLRLVGGNVERTWDGRGHFFAAAAEAMRRILVEQARRKMSTRHGGKLRRVELDEQAAIVPGDHEILALDEALTKLAKVRPQAGKLVELRFFTGMTVEEAAQNIGISARTARRLWVFSQAWLRREMQSPKDDQP
jgi:RNA polymerase sigma factor (TIGR02999 family)